MPGPPPKCPNPLFTLWLQEWRDEAARQGRVKSQHAYERALCSLRKYPLPLRSGCEARILQYFGEQICRQLDERLEKHQSKGNTTTVTAQLENPVSLKEQENADSASGDEGLYLQAKQPTSRKHARKYVPAARSGAYAILVALYQDGKNPHTRGYLTKPELQRAAQPLCDKPFTLVDPGKKNTAWSAVGTLIRKELVLKTNIPARYSLTEKGRTLAQELTAVAEPKENHPSLPTVSETGAGELLQISEPDGQTPSKSVTDALPESSYREPRAGQFQPQFIFHPGKFDVILCVDFIETTGGPTSRKQDLVNELHHHNVPFTVRKLHIGDFVWVARERVSAVAGKPQPRIAQELVLDYIVERKRMSDLCGSIIDGRFREQKFRLRQCGVSRPIYLVEDSGSVQHLSLPEKTLQQAIVNTQVVDGFFVKRTRDLRESAAYLTLMTRHLSNLYQSSVIAYLCCLGNCPDKTLVSCTKEELERVRPLQAEDGSYRLLTFTEFNEGAVKNKAQTVSEVFARQLMQISGISGDKAAAILERHKTPASLLAAYAACQNPQSRERLLSEVKCGKLQRNLGPTLSRTLAQLYSTAGPLP